MQGDGGEHIAHLRLFPVEVRHGESGSVTQDTDPVRSQFRCVRLRQGHDACLGGCIGGESHAGHLCGKGGRIDEYSAFFSHLLIGDFPAEELAEKVRQVGASITVLPMGKVPCSSREVQEAVERYEEPQGLSSRVATYIAENGLYHDPAMEKRVREMMTEKRFRHTLGVRKQAVLLAGLHGIPLQKAALAALLHDCAKCRPFVDMKAAARDGGLTDPDFYSSPEMLHGPAGAAIARQDFGVTDDDVLNAITYHTMGRAWMSPLELCIFIADATEPGRRDYPGLQKIRKLSYQSLTRAALLSLLHTRDYVLEQGKAFNPLSEKTIAWLQETADDGFDRSTGI